MKENNEISSWFAYIPWLFSSQLIKTCYFCWW
jgi:hypothetical protein